MVIKEVEVIKEVPVEKVVEVIKEIEVHKGLGFQCVGDCKTSIHGFESHRRLHHSSYRMVD